MKKESIKSITDIKKLADADIPISQKKFFRPRNGAEYYEISRTKLTALARELLRYFYQLDDIARKDTIKLVRGMLEYHTDPERKMELMAFKKRSYRWKEVKGGL